MSNEIAISFPLGLGDTIIVAGAIEYLTTQYEKVYIPCRKANLDSVAALFSERVMLVPIDEGALSKITEEQFDSEASEKTELNFFKSEYFKNIEVRNCVSKFDLSVSFAENYYQNLGLDYSIRWEFSPIRKLQSQLVRARDSYDIADPFIFVHDDKERGYAIEGNSSPMGEDFNSAPIGALLYRPIGESSILGYLGFLQYAKEIHCIDSVFAHLADSMELPGETKLFFHEYARPGSLRKLQGDRLDRLFQKDWTIYPQDPLACLGEDNCLLDIGLLAHDGIEVARATVSKNTYFRIGRGRVLRNIKPIKFKPSKMRRKNFDITMVVVARKGVVVRKLRLNPLHIADLHKCSICFPESSLWI